MAINSLISQKEIKKGEIVHWIASIVLLSFINLSFAYVVVVIGIETQIGIWTEFMDNTFISQAGPDECIHCVWWMNFNCRPLFVRDFNPLCWVGTHQTIRRCHNPQTSEKMSWDIHLSSASAVWLRSFRSGMRLLRFVSTNVIGKVEENRWTHFGRLHFAVESQQSSQAAIINACNASAKSKCRFRQKRFRFDWNKNL